jgi:hypothetical protein
MQQQQYSSYQTPAATGAMDGQGNQSWGVNQAAGVEQYSSTQQLLQQQTMQQQPQSSTYGAQSQYGVSDYSSMGWQNPADSVQAIGTNMYSNMAFNQQQSAYGVQSQLTDSSYMGKTDDSAAKKRTFDDQAAGNMAGGFNQYPNQFYDQQQKRSRFT